MPVFRVLPSIPRVIGNAKTSAAGTFNMPITFGNLVSLGDALGAELVKLGNSVVRSELVLGEVLLA